MSGTFDIQVGDMHEHFQLDPAFTQSALEAWRKAIEKDLKGAPFEKKLITQTYEGLPISPVYTTADAPADLGDQEWPGSVPGLRGSEASGQIKEGWDIRTYYNHPDPCVVHKEVLADLQGGAHSLWFQLDDAIQQGREMRTKTAPNGICISNIADLYTLLEGVHLDMVSLHFSAGLATVPLVGMFAEYCKKQGYNLEDVRVHFGADPLALLGRLGDIPQKVNHRFEEIAHLAVWLDANMPQSSAVTINTMPYQESGADYAQELAYAIASGVQILRAMVDAGLSLERALRQINFRFAVGNHAFQEIAKLRAARLLWARVVEVCGGTEANSNMQIHAVSSNRALTQRDPYNNMLRTTVACFAAGLAGAEAVTTASFDQSLGFPSDLGRRIARNTQVILQEESHLHRVIDPAGGSWFIERHTRELAESAWEHFRELESNGGMGVALVTGKVAEDIAAVWANRRKNLASTKDAITGVSAYPQLEEPTSHVKVVDMDAIKKRSAAAPPLTENDAAAVAAAYNQGINAFFEVLKEVWQRGVRLQSVTSVLYTDDNEESVTPLPQHYLAEPFELLRNATDRAAVNGARPKVFLVNLGRVADFTARSTYARNFFTAGGFEIVNGDNLGEDVKLAAAKCHDSGCKIAVICSSDPIYEKLAADSARALKLDGIQTVILAGRPGDAEQAYRDAGVDRFIFMGCNVLDTLTALLNEEGVLS